jgi:hemoglobin
MTSPTQMTASDHAGHRAAITRDLAARTGLNDAVLERLVRAFYATARQDAVIGPLFDGVHDWEKHIARITVFWSSVALLTGQYHGQPFAAHMKLPLEPHHFARWLTLFESSAREICTTEGVAHLMDKAHRIARSLELGIAAARNELPVRRDEARPRG